MGMADAQEQVNVLMDRQVNAACFPSCSADGGQVPLQKQPLDPKSALKEYILSRLEDGFFLLDDQFQGEKRKLRLIRIHRKILKIKESYYVCVDFRDVSSKDLLDVDFVFDLTEGKVAIRKIEIHKVNGIRRLSVFH